MVSWRQYSPVIGPDDDNTDISLVQICRVDHDLLFPLAADKSPGLAGRPKMIFVQVQCIIV